MKNRTTLVVLLALPVLGSCGGIGAPPHVGQPTVQAQSMQRMLADVDQIRAYVYGGGALPDADAAALELVSWSRRMAELFPPGQASNDYVDMSPARVAGAPTAMSQAADLLLTAVRSGGRPAIGDQLAQAERDGCGFCHLSGSR